MPTLQEQLETTVQQISADSTLFHDMVHGDVETEVLTENGSVKSIAKTILENEQLLSESISTLTAMRDEAIDSAVSAAQSESNTEALEENALNAALDAQTAAGVIAAKWLFDDDTVVADPGIGAMRLNHADAALVTALVLSAQTAETGMPDLSDFIKTWGDSTNVDKGYIILRKGGTPQTFCIYKVIGSVVDNGAWLEIPVSYVAGSGAFVFSDALYLAFSRIGDKGIGDLIAGNNLSDLADAAAARDNLGLGSAALKNAGTDAGELVELEAGAKLPAVDGSQLLNVPGVVVGRAYAENKAVASCSAIPQDDSIPQITQGSEVISLAYAASKSTNRLRFTFTGSAGSTGNVYGATAFFRNSTANALFAVMKNAYANMYGGASHDFSWEMEAGNTSLNTYSVRIGISTGTTYLNGSSAGVRRFGGVQAANLIIEEIEV